MSALFDLFGVTRRQEQCLRLLAEGMSHKQISSELKISQKTCESHVHTAKQRLGAKTTTHAVVIAILNGGIVVCELRIKAKTKGKPKADVGADAVGGRVPALHAA